MIEFLGKGTLLGLAAGFSPGPLLVLVISETLRYNIGAGLRVAVVPVITDLPIILAVMLVLSRISEMHMVLGGITLLGGFYLIYLGYESFGATTAAIGLDESKPRSLQKGVITNFLNPAPYLFWISVGSPIIVQSAEISPAATIAFIASFYLLLVGAKVAVALAVGRSRRFLQGKIYTGIMRSLGIALMLFSLLFFRDGLRYLGG